MFLDIFLFLRPSENDFSNVISLDKICYIVIGHCIIHYISNWENDIRIERSIGETNIFTTSVNTKSMRNFHCLSIENKEKEIRIYCLFSVCNPKNILDKSKGISFTGLRSLGMGEGRNSRFFLLKTRSE